MNAMFIYGTSKDNVLNNKCTTAQPIKFARKIVKQDCENKVTTSTRKRTASFVKEPMSVANTNKLESPKGKMIKEDSVGYRNPILNPDCQGKQTRKKIINPTQKEAYEANAYLQNPNVKRMEYLKEHNKSSLFDENMRPMQNEHHTTHVVPVSCTMKGLLSYQAIRLY